MTYNTHAPTVSRPPTDIAAKVQAAGAAGAVTTLLVFVLQFVAPEFAAEIPEGVIAGATAIIAFAAGYIKKGRPVE